MTIIEQGKQIPNLPERKYAHWKSAVGLPEKFPKLRPLEGKELDPESRTSELHFALPHYEAVGQIMDSVSGQLPVAVLVRQGQGCTTLSRFVFGKVRKEGTKRGLVSTHLELSDTEPRSVEETVRRALVYDWVVNQNMGWRNELGNPDVVAILSLVQTAILGNYWDEASVNSAGPFGRATADLLKDTLLGRPIVDLLKSGFFRDRKVSLQVDLSSPTAYEDSDDYEEDVQSLQKRVRKLSEQVPNRITEMYFVIPDGFQALQRGWNREYQVIEYPEYSSSDIFAMLSRRYQPRDGALATVVNPSLLKASNQPINQTVQEFSKRLLERLAQSDDIPYRVG